MMPLFDQGHDVYVDGMHIYIVHLRLTRNPSQISLLMSLDQATDVLGGSIEVVSAASSIQFQLRPIESHAASQCRAASLLTKRIDCSTENVPALKRRCICRTDQLERNAADSAGEYFRCACSGPDNLSQLLDTVATLLLPRPLFFEPETKCVHHEEKDWEPLNADRSPGPSLTFPSTPSATLVEYVSDPSSNASVIILPSDKGGIATPHVDESAIRSFLKRSYPRNVVRTAEINVIKRGGQGAIIKVQMNHDIVVVVKVLNDTHRRGLLESTLLIQTCMTAMSNEFNIVPIRDFQLHQHIGHLILMDYADGSSLFELLGSEMLQDDMKELIAQDLIAQVSKLHDLGVCHRDIAPKNIMVLCTGVVTLIDFDLCCCFNDKLTFAVGVDKLPAAIRSRMCNMAVGTRGYIAPEVESGTKYTIDADWYSVGATIAAMKPENEKWLDCAYELMSHSKEPSQRPLALRYPCIYERATQSTTRQRLAEVAIATRLLVDSKRVL